jgi:hypothetical protein
MMDKMTAEQVTRITEHKSEAVFAEYADSLLSGLNEKAIK